MIFSIQFPQVQWHENAYFNVYFLKDFQGGGMPPDPTSRALWLTLLSIPKPPEIQPPSSWQHCTCQVSVMLYTAQSRYLVVTLHYIVDVIMGDIPGSPGADLVDLRLGRLGFSSSPVEPFAFCSLGFGKTNSTHRCLLPAYLKRPKCCINTQIKDVELCRLYIILKTHSI